MTDKELLLACRRDISHFEELVRRFEKKLLHFIHRITNISREEGEEMLQEIFVKIWKYIESYDDTYAVSTWMYRIARNYVISQARKRKIRPHEQALSLDDGGYEWIPDPESFGQLEEELEGKYEKERVQEALETLPLKYKELLVLKYFEEKSYEEMSDILRKPPGTVATHLHRAKLALRKKLDKLPRILPTTP